MIRKDERTPEEMKTHTYLIAGTDGFMSGWGEANDGISVAAWACKPEHSTRVFNWVHDRSDMKRIREVLDPYNPKCAHLHIYVVNEGHPALS